MATETQNGYAIISYVVYGPRGGYRKQFWDPESAKAFAATLRSSTIRVGLQRSYDSPIYNPDPIPDPAVLADNERIQAVLRGLFSTMTPAEDPFA